MKLPGTSIRSKGFTLIELLVVVTLFAGLAVLGLAVSFGTYRAYDLQAETDKVVSAFQTARSRSLANINEQSHGVCYDDPSHSVYLVTPSATQCTDGEKIKIAEAIKIDPTSWPNPIFFSQLSGEVSSPPAPTLTYDGKTITIEINQHGRINWTKI